ncbi:hypothetical protein SVAN01_08844 [Stagonosporopsis vannaccii]|nr:hypothetical protein SVAN01_08844 [Stagonosporopsis vannaccii]
MAPSARYTVFAPAPGGKSKTRTRCTKLPERRHPGAVWKEAALCDEIPCGVCSN